MLFRSNILKNGPYQNRTTAQSAITNYENEIKKCPLSHDDIESFLNHFEQMFTLFTREIGTMANPREHIQETLKKYSWDNCSLVANIFFQ